MRNEIGQTTTMDSGPWTTAFGSNEVDAPSQDTLGGMFLRSVTDNTESRALVDLESSCTFGELGAESWELARGLAAAGVTKGTRVGVLLPNSAVWIAASFAVALNGGILVPISTLATPEERDHILEFADVSVLLAGVRSGPRELLAELEQTYAFLANSPSGAIASQHLPYLRRIFVHGLEARTGAFEPWSALVEMASAIPSDVIAARAASVVPTDDAVVYFTSGSTSKPKAVLHMHRGPVTTMRAMAQFQGLGPDERLLGGKQFFWVGMTSTVGACLASGATYVGMERFKAGDAVHLIERERVTVVNCSPHQLEQIGQAAESGDYDLNTLRLVEPSRLSRAAGLPEGHEYLIGYGMTETAGVLCSLPGDAPVADRRSSNGAPLQGVEIRIVDPETGRELPAGTSGLVQIKGPTVMHGYLKQAPEVARNGDYLVTQDLGRVDGNGLFHFDGRTSGLIKTNGANVSTSEIEEAVRGWAGLKNAFIVGVPHPTLGEAVVLVAVGDGQSFDRDALEGYLKSRVAAFKVPKAVVFIDGPDVPRTVASDKVDYPRLRTWAIGQLAEHSDEGWRGYLQTNHLAAFATNPQAQEAQA